MHEYELNLLYPVKKLMNYFLKYVNLNKPWSKTLV